MKRLRMNIWFVLLASLSALSAAAQSQSCPMNVDFSKTTLDHWEAYTGNNQGGNGTSAILQTYDSNRQAPSGTIGATSFPEYQLPNVDGIRVISTQSYDAFGNFHTIPTINGYTYRYSVLLGSTSVADHGPGGPASGQPGGGQPNQGGQSGTLGGYVRGISYLIAVPPGPATVPYTMTYAYAMVLENGTHASAEQPMARATVSTPGGVIACASPAYFLPTSGGELDSATARANGFSPSPVPTPNVSVNQGTAGLYLKDVWTKGWTEVTFDLSAYRGQMVTLTFEADNCVPGGHFAYAYFALRDVCAGLQISGDSAACSNSDAIFSVPALDSASYAWSVPNGWAINSGSDGNTLAVTVGPQSGYISVREQNSCTALTGSLFVQLYKGALPQAVTDPHDTTVCYGQSVPLQALISTGTAYSWSSQESLTGASNGPVATVPFAVNAVAAPQQTTDYILNIRNDGCPVTVSDTFTVTIVQPFQVSLGDDTLVVVGEPLHFNAHSGDIYQDAYQWTPSTDLDNPDIANPIGQYAAGINKITYQVEAIDMFGCYAKASVSVTIAPTPPDMFVPNAFTPGGSSNSLFRPICIGMSSLDYFRVFNRWGQLLYKTSRMGEGWDGRIDGKLQETNAFLWEARGTDYTGRVILKRGTVVLVR